MFGDNEAYHNKFKTAARVRPRELQKLGAEFYDLEHSKPLFNKNNLLTVHHLYKYCCLLEMFKIIKLRIPIALYSLFTRSNRRENYFITNSQGRIQGGSDGGGRSPLGKFDAPQGYQNNDFHLKIRAVFSLMSSEKCHIAIFARPPP